MTTLEPHPVGSIRLVFDKKIWRYTSSMKYVEITKITPKYYKYRMINREIIGTKETKGNPYGYLYLYMKIKPTQESNEVLSISKAKANFKIPPYNGYPMIKYGDILEYKKKILDYEDTEDEASPPRVIDAIEEDVVVLESPIDD